MLGALLGILQGGFLPKKISADFLVYGQNNFSLSNDMINKNYNSKTKYNCPLARAVHPNKK